MTIEECVQKTAMIKVGDKVQVRQPDGNYCYNKRWYIRYKWSDDTARVMTIIDGYAMLRFKSCKPFVKKLNELNLPGVLDSE